MASTTFTNNVTLTDAAWFNDVNAVAYTIFGDGSAYTGNITLNTNKFTVAYASGNTAVAGTLAVTGATTAAAITMTGDLQQNNATYVRGKTAAAVSTRILGISGGDVLFLGSVDTALSGGLVYVNNGATHFQVSSAGAMAVIGSVTALSATAIPAGGTAGAGLLVSSATNFGVFFGSGAPSLSAAKGSLYLRSDGSTTNNRMYVNTDGSTTWTAVTTAA